MRLLSLLPVAKIPDIIEIAGDLFACGKADHAEIGFMGKVAHLILVKAMLNHCKC